MRKFFKIIAKILLGLIVLIGIALFLLLDQVDFTSYLETEYYNNTITRFDQERKATTLSTGQVQIGLSKVNITPSKRFSLSANHIPLAGYGAREGGPAQGVHDSLYIKALAIKVDESLAVIVGTDMLIMPPNIVDSVSTLLEKRSNIGRDQILYSATHTHSSVGGWASNFVGEAFSGEPNDNIVTWLSEKFAEAIIKAIANLQPGQIGVGQFEAPDLVRNRLVGDKGLEHSTCTFIQAHQHNGKKAIVGIFDAHATTLSAKNWKFSADYPFYWYQKMETNGIDLPIFCAGSVGSHGPESGGAKGFEKAKFIGEQLAERMIRNRSNIILEDTVSLASLTIAIDLPKFQVRISDGLSLAPFAAKSLFPPFGKVHLQSIRLNDFILTTTPADYSGELALRNQNELLKKGYRSTITSFNGAYTGYVLPAKYYHLNEYESRTMSWFGPNMGPYLEEMIDRMTGALVELE